ncbi:MAG: FAD-dependent oxidoreductase, partial [Bacilli bacterium]|nr:FAD-dependent oxidoreductase [Bacilli bacterium]
MKYDIIIIGAGPGGYVAAIKAAQMGARVALIEKDSLGGVCLNFGCIPTKALIKSAKVYRNILDSNKYGIDLNHDSLKVNWAAIIRRKDQIVDRLTNGVKILLSKNGVKLIQGEAKVLNPHQVEVNGETLDTKNLILANGANPIIPPIA